METAC